MKAPGGKLARLMGGDSKKTIVYEMFGSPNSKFRFSNRVPLPNISLTRPRVIIAIANPIEVPSASKKLARIEFLLANDSALSKIAQFVTMICINNAICR